MLPDWSSTSLIVVVVISCVAGAAKVAFGIGAGVLLTPIAALVLPPKEAVALMAPMMLITDFVAIPHHWRKWSTRHVLLLLPTAFAGVILGTLFLAWAPPLWVKRAIGIIALLFVATQLWRRLRPADGSAKPLPDWLGYVIGLLAGIASSIAHAGGIVMSIYLLGVGLTKQIFVSSIIATFFLTDTTKLIAYWQTGVLTFPILLAGIALTPAMLIGGGAGAFLNRRLTVSQFTTMMMVLVGISGALLLTSS